MSLATVVIRRGLRAVSSSARRICRTTTRTSKRTFHATQRLRWVTPDSLSTSELRRECERRELPVSGNRTALLERIEMKLRELGGYDNGLTLDSTLVADKREIETQMNRIPDNHHMKSQIAVEPRIQTKLKKLYEEDDRVTFHKKSPYVTVEGKYSEMCSLRAQVAAIASEIASNETIYALPHNIVLRLKRAILQDLRREHEVSFSVMRPEGMGSDMILLAVEGDTQKRMSACESLEAIINKIRTNQLDVPGLEAYSRPPARRRRRKSTSFDEALIIFPDAPNVAHPSYMGEAVSDCFNVFQGTVLFVDSRMREMLHDYRNRLDAIAAETSTNVFLGARDLFWLNDSQLAIEGDEKNVAAARSQIDQLINQLKSLTMTLVLPPSINDQFARESKSLANSIQKQLGVDTVIIEQDYQIFVHLIGTSVQVNAASTIIDSRVYRLNRISGSERAYVERRERVRNLNFLDMGIGGLDDSLRAMLRRTFESRLISPRLRKELGLTHVRGVLLYGPPGTGKTLIARKISDILGCKEPKIVNGPEVESKWVGEAEKNIRALFEEAGEEFKEKGEDSELHIVIFDEIDAIAKKRGGAHAKSRDGALNQLLCCMDGVQGLDNILVFGLTNRKDCLDPALLRPGRLEAQLEITLPDMQGREDILKIHTRAMREHGRLAPNADLRLLAQYAEDFSGADISGMIRSAISFALEDCEDEDDVQIDQQLLERGLHEVRMAKDRLPSDRDPEENYPGLLQA